MAAGKNDKGKSHEEKLADAETAEHQRRKDALPRPNRTESRVMRQARDTEIEGDN